MSALSDAADIPFGRVEMSDDDTNRPPIWARYGIGRLILSARLLKSPVSLSRWMFEWFDDERDVARVATTLAWSADRCCVYLSNGACCDKYPNCSFIHAGDAMVRRIGDSQRWLVVKSSADGACGLSDLAGPPVTHREMVLATQTWLREMHHCSVVMAEKVSRAFERPDAIGWANGFSVLVECKTSRSDFLADASKPHRAYPESGMGRLRWYVTPTGLLSASELPPGWGLAEYDGASFAVVQQPVPMSRWNTLAETQHLVSEVRRRGR